MRMNQVGFFLQGRKTSPSEQVRSTSSESLFVSRADVGSRLILVTDCYQHHKLVSCHGGSKEKAGPVQYAGSVPLKKAGLSWRSTS